MTTKPVLRVFLDQNVADSVARAFRDAGHEVTHLRDRLAPDSPDPLVAAIAEAANAILVSHDTDMKALMKRINIGRRRFAKLSRIKLSCRESRAAGRVQLFLPIIELEFAHCQALPDRRLMMEIGNGVLRIER